MQITHVEWIKVVITRVFGIPHGTWLSVAPIFACHIKIQQCADSDKPSYRGAAALCKDPAVRQILSAPASRQDDGNTADAHRNMGAADRRLAGEAGAHGTAAPLPSMADSPFAAGVGHVTERHTRGAKDVDVAQDTACVGSGAGGSDAGWIGLVFGREAEGLTEAEVLQCDATCCLPLGRLQESISLSHAVTVALSEVFQFRMQHLPDSLVDLYCPGNSAESPGG